MNKDVLEGNKLIAEFMGITPSEKGWYDGYELQKAGLLLAMASMMAVGSEPHRRELREKPALSDAEKQAKQRELNLRKGLKEFYMGDGTVVWALNEKNAIRKFKKKSNDNTRINN